jgi:hypothetical protein
MGDAGRLLRFAAVSSMKEVDRCADKVDVRISHANGRFSATRRNAQFEHSIGVTPKGFEIFTLSPQGLHAPGVEI